MINPNHSIDYTDAGVWNQWRNALADYPQVLRAINTVEDCEADLEDAAVTLALQGKLEPDGSRDWLWRFAKRFRSLICREFYPHHPPGLDSPVELVIHLVRYLVAESDCPDPLVFPVALAVITQDRSSFCGGISGSTLP
jgi:hypothetical protein